MHSRCMEGALSPWELPVSHAAAWACEEELRELVVDLERRLEERAVVVGRALCHWEGGHRERFERAERLAMLRAAAVLSGLRAAIGRPQATVARVDRYNAVRRRQERCW